MPSFRTFWTPVHYADYEMLKEAVWGQTEDFYFSGINSLLEKCRKFIELGKDYTEKLSVVCNISILLYGRVAKLFERPSYILGILAYLTLNRIYVTSATPTLQFVPVSSYTESLYLSVTPKFYTKVLHQTTGLTPNTVVKWN